MNTCLQPAFNQKKIEKQQINIVLMKGAFILKVFLPPIMTSNYFPIMNIRSGRFIAVFMYNCQNHLLPTNFIKERTRMALTVFNCPFPYLLLKQDCKWRASFVYKSFVQPEILKEQAGRWRGIYPRHASNCRTLDSCKTCVGKNPEKTLCERENKEEMSVEML